MSEEPHYVVYMDTREASGKPGIKSGLEKLGAEVIVENLGNAVDYIIPGPNDIRHGIQRKTPSEMMSPKKAFEDIIQMKMMENTVPFLLLEGPLSIIQKFARNMPIAPIIGGLESIMLDYGVMIIPSPNMYWTTNWLYRRAKRLNSVRKKHIMSVGEKLDRELPLHEQGRKIIETLPNIGPKLAVRIMQAHESAKNALDNIDSWVMLEGIAEGKVYYVKEVLYAKWPRSETAISVEPPTVSGDTGVENNSVGEQTLAGSDSSDPVDTTTSVSQEGEVSQSEESAA